MQVGKHVYMYLIRVEHNACMTKSYSYREPPPRGSRIGEDEVGICIYMYIHLITHV